MVDGDAVCDVSDGRLRLGAPGVVAHVKPRQRGANFCATQNLVHAGSEIYTAKLADT